MLSQFALLLIVSDLFSGPCSFPPKQVCDTITNFTHTDSREPEHQRPLFDPNTVFTAQTCSLIKAADMSCKPLIHQSMLMVASTLHPLLPLLRVVPKYRNLIKVEHLTMLICREVRFGTRGHQQKKWMTRADRLDCYWNKIFVIKWTLWCVPVCNDALGLCLVINLVHPLPFQQWTFAPPWIHLSIKANIWYF